MNADVLFRANDICFNNWHAEFRLLDNDFLQKETRLSVTVGTVS